MDEEMILAHGAGVFAGAAQAGNDRVGILGVEREKMNHVLLGGLRVTFGERLVVARRIDDRLPLLLVARRAVEHQLQIDIDEARHVLGAFDVTAQPINGIGDTAQHAGKDAVRRPPELPASP
jgi:hypothetical protein